MDSRAIPAASLGVVVSRLTSLLAKQKQHVLLSNCQQTLPSWYSLLNPTFCNVNCPQMFHFEESPQPLPWCGSTNECFYLCGGWKRVGFVGLQRDPDSFGSKMGFQIGSSNKTIRLCGLHSYLIKLARNVSFINHVQNDRRSFNHP